MAQIIGLTGGIASGKSTIASFFKDEGIPVIETDQIAKTILQPGSDAFSAVVKHFGEEILLSEGIINRKALGERIFKDEHERDILNQIIHPEVRIITQSKADVLKKEGHAIIVIDVPLLFEAGFDQDVDQTLVVSVPKDIQIERLMARDGIEKAYALKKTNAQMPLKEKRKRADFVIDNRGSILDTKNQFNEVLKALKEA